jgi:hypothetical protein
MVEIKDHGPVEASRRKHFAVHQRVSRTSYRPEIDGTPEIHGMPVFGYVLSHLPTGSIVATCDDPEELLSLGDELLAARFTRSKSWKHSVRAILPLYRVLAAAGRWPPQDIARRQEATL